MYKKLIYFLLTIPMLFSSLNADLCTDCDEHRHHTSNVIAPVVRLTTTPCLLTEHTGMSLLGEVGTRNYRIGATVGGTLGNLLDGTFADNLRFASDQNRFKLSFEFLSQALKYSFASGSTRRWVNQYAVGGGYQYKFSEDSICSNWINSIDLNLSYSYACSRHLKALGCGANDNAASTYIFRNIAGGQNAHVGLGTTLNLWSSGTFFVAADYDYTFYNRKYEHDKRTSGVGATLRLNQNFADNFSFEATTEFRRPFNYYEGSVNWSTPISNGNLKVGTYVSYTNGRNKLPNNTTAGISVDFAFGGGPLLVYNSASCFGGSYYSDYCTPSYGCSDSQLLAWIAQPAVYMPTVLAIPDQAVVTYQPVCVAPITTPFPTNNIQQPINLPFNAGPYFSGTNLVFSLSQTSDPITINPVTGLITATDIISSIGEVTVIATNSCGVAQQTLFYIFTQP